MSRLSIVPISRAEAKAFVERVHRHHRPSVGDKFCLGLARDEEVVGVAIVGRPVSRMLDDGWTVEVTRVAVREGMPNGCSMLYGAAWRVARGLGYLRCVTYTLPVESGASLRAAGWRCIGIAGGGSWSRKSRPRVDLHPTQTKLRWEVDHGVAARPPRMDRNAARRERPETP